MKKTLVTGLASLIFWSCNTPDQSQLNALNKLQNELDSATFYINSVDLDKMTTLGSKAKKDLNYISENLKIEITRDEALRLANYRTGMKALTKMKSTYLKTKSDITFSSNQLSELSKDIHNNVLTQAEAEAYLADEANAIHTNLLMSRRSAEAYQQGIILCTQEQPLVDSVINLLYTNGYR